MASRKALLIAAAAMGVVIVGALLPATAVPSFSNLHVVGGIEGWNLGVNYTDWASKYEGPILVGDKLAFRYETGEHTVVMVKEDGYNNCNVDGNIGYWDDGGNTVVQLQEDDGENTVVQLQEAGKSYFFICGTGDHCKQGMKLAITTQNTNE